MKKILIAILIICLSPVIGKTQSHSKNTLSFNLDFDAGIHGTVSEYYYNNVLIDQDTSAAGTKMFRFDAQYNILKFLSAGFTFRKGSYVEDPDNVGANGNKIGIVSLGLRLYPINKDKFAMYLGLNFGSSHLQINRVNTIIVSINQRYEWQSPHFSAEFGFNWYFAKNIGMNFNLGYAGHNFNLKEYYINSTQQNLTNQKHTFITKGAHVGIGLAFRLLGDN